MDNRQYIFTFFSIFAIFAAVFYLSDPSHFNPSTDRNIASFNTQKSYKAKRLRRTRKLESPFAYRKVNIRKALKAKARSQLKSAVSATQTIPQGSRLMAIVDNHCLRNNYSATLSKRVSNALNLSKLKVQAYSLTVQRDTDINDLIEEAQYDDCLVGITDDGYVEAGSLYDDADSFKQKHLANIKVQTSEDFFFNSSLRSNKKVVIAIVDTGVDYNHSDLKTRMWKNASGHHGFDFVNDDNDPMDDNEHGTHVAGLAAAASNGTGVVGVIPKYAEIMAIKVLDEDGGGSFSKVANGIRFAADNGADIINLSLSGSGLNSGVEDAIVYALNKGIPVIAAAGNDDVEVDEDDNALTPASMALANAGLISVGAIDSVTSQKSSFSNFSNKYIEIAAPGSNGILSTIPNESFDELNGTSMATPIVTGAAALAIYILKSSQYPYTPEEIEDVVTEGAFENQSLKSEFKNGRQLDLEKMKLQLRHDLLAPLDGGIDNAF